MVQIKCLSNGLYSLKNSHIPFGMGFHPPLPLPLRQNSVWTALICYIGSSLTCWFCCCFFVFADGPDSSICHFHSICVVCAVSPSTFRFAVMVVEVDHIISIITTNQPPTAAYEMHQIVTIKIKTPARSGFFALWVSRFSFASTA